MHHILYQTGPYFRMSPSSICDLFEGATKIIVVSNTRFGASSRDLVCDGHSIRINALVSPCGFEDVAVDDGVLVTNRAFGGGFIETDFDGVFNCST